MHVHVQYLGVLHDGVNMSVTTVHMVLFIIWRVLNLGWVYSRPPSFILATSTSYIPRMGRVAIGVKPWDAWRSGRS